MKFVCDRCQTRYSIADEKVRQKILKIRCKTCDNVITVRDSAEPSGAPTPVARPTGSSIPVARITGPSAAAGAKPAAAGLGGSRASLPRPPTPPAPPPRLDQGPAEWHVAIDGSDEGPFNRVDLARRILTQKPGAEIYVWKEGFDGWKEPKDVPDIQRELGAQRLRPPSALPPPPGRRPSQGGLPAPNGANGRSVPLSALSEAKSERDAARASAKAAASDGFDDEGEATQIQSIDAALVAESVPPGRTSGQRAAIKSEPPSAPTPIAGTGLEGLDLGAARPASPYASPYVPAPAGAAEHLVHPSSPSPPPGESSLMKMPGAAGLFARNPAMKYVVAAGAVVVLVIVVVIANIGGSLEVKAPARDEHAATGSPGSPKAVDDPEAEARRKAEAWFGKSGEEAAHGASGSKAVVGTAPGSKPSLIRRLIGRGDRATPADPGSTSPPPVGTEPPPVNPNEVTESRKLGGTFGDRGERIARPVGPTASGGGEVSQEKLSSVVTNRINQDSIKSCYNRALRHEGGNLKGRLDVTVSIGASGRVKNVSLSSGPELGTVHGCVKTAISRWVFPANREEYAFGFPLILQGS